MCVCIYIHTKWNKTGNTGNHISELIIRRRAGWQSAGNGIKRPLNGSKSSSRRILIWNVLLPPALGIDVMNRAAMRWLVVKITPSRKRGRERETRCIMGHVIASQQEPPSNNAEMITIGGGWVLCAQECDWFRVSPAKREREREREEGGGGKGEIPTLPTYPTLWHSPANEI